METFKETYKKRIEQMDMRSPLQTPTTQNSSLQMGLLQRKCAQCDEKEKLLQRQAVNQSEVLEVPPIVHEVMRSSGQPLDTATRTLMESRFGHDFSGVKVHTDAKAVESARLINARAYTVGQDIAFGTGQYAPHSPQGQRLLAHELTHTLQQKAPPGPISAAQAAQLEGEAHRTAETIWPSTSAPVFSAAPIGIQRDPNKQATAKDAETVLGERLWQEFSSGVNIAFYDANEPEAQRRATDWAKEYNAVGLKGKKTTADQVVFGKAIPDTLKLANTIIELSNVLNDAATKVPMPSVLDPSKGANPAKIKTLAIFAHGTSNWCGLGSGITSSNAAKIIKAIAPSVTSDFKVILYTCNSARGSAEDESWMKGTLKEGGADSLAATVRDALANEGIKQGEVWGHTTTGHVSRNFALRFFMTSGKGHEGLSYAGFYVWGVVERSSFLFHLQGIVEEKGYVIDEKSGKRFFAKAAQAMDKLMYDCYAKANKELTYNGKNLAEMAPMNPSEVGKIIREYWDKNYWTQENREKIADKLIRDAKLENVKK